MHHFMKLLLFMLIGLTVNAQTINLRGTVSNSTGKAIANAIVTLVNQGLKDTTGTDGAYVFSRITAVTPIPLIPQRQTILLDKGFLEFSLPKTALVKVEIFDVQGNLLKRVLRPNASKGFYRFNIEENSRTSQLLIVRTSIDQDAFTFRYLPLHGGNYVVHPSNGSLASAGGKLSQVPAISDSLKITATGYTTKAVGITSYDQALNITLDTAGGSAKPSAGCGKTPTFTGEPRVTINVTAAGTGNRDYIIRLPADYDKNHPYALWFTIHCMSGSAENVAHSEPDTRARYEYLGMWRCANPTGGKGTTIFCAPEGISAAWGQGQKDLEFFRAMVRKFEDELCIDKSRIFASGFSMGGSMSYALACAMPDTMRAIAMHSGGSMSGCDGTHRGPVPIFITHGTDDGTCRWPGSGVPQINDLAVRDGCKTEDLFAKCKPTDRMHPVCVEYQNCNPGYPCRACIFKGEHIGSPGTQGSYGKNDTWVPDSTWSYFKRFY